MGTDTQWVLSGEGVTHLNRAQPSAPGLLPCEAGPAYHLFKIIQNTSYIYIKHLLSASHLLSALQALTRDPPGKAMK